MYHRPDFAQVECTVPVRSKTKGSRPFQTGCLEWVCNVQDHGRVRRLIPYALLGFLAIGSALGLGFGLSAAPAGRASLTPSQIVAAYRFRLIAEAGLRDNTNDPVIYPRVTRVKCGLPKHWVVGHTFTCVALSARGVRQGTYTIAEATNDRIGDVSIRFVPPTEVIVPTSQWVPSMIVVMSGTNGITMSPPSGLQQSHVSRSGALSAVKSTYVRRTAKTLGLRPPSVLFGVLHDNEVSAFAEYRNLPVWVVKYSGFPASATKVGEAQKGSLYCFVEARTGGELFDLYVPPTS
jgi:hypothetical protein